MLEKANRVISASQGANFLLLVISQTTSMFLRKMNSYPLGTGPLGTTEGTLAFPIMFVSSMPL